MTLTDAQRKLVEDNIGLVGKVIHDKVHYTDGFGCYTYDDLFQIGCIGLCKAAGSTKEHSARFSTYAYRIIWHEICDALIYASRRGTTEHSTDPHTIVQLTPAYEDPTNTDLQNTILQIMNEADGILAKGIEAIYYQSLGYSCQEIADRMHVPTNHVTAWMTKARKYLRKHPALKDESNERLTNS